MATNFRFDIPHDMTITILQAVAATHASSSLQKSCYNLTYISNYGGTLSEFSDSSPLKSCLTKRIRTLSQKRMIG